MSAKDSWSEKTLAFGLVDDRQRQAHMRALVGLTERIQSGLSIANGSMIAADGRD